MQLENRTVVGIFSDITEAKRAADELHSKGISTARLVENELALTFTGTAERQGNEAEHTTSDEPHKRGGVRAFFARLFGFDDHASWDLDGDSESYFQNAYQNKKHLIIIEDCSEIVLCRHIIHEFGGVAEESGGHYYQAGRSSQQTKRSGAAVDPAAESGLGLDVDHMPFSHPSHEASATSGKRAGDRALNGVAGDADRTPLAGTSSRSDSEAGRQNLGAQIVGDDRIHDRGVSNADVARISSDRIMDQEEEDERAAADEAEELEEFKHSRRQATEESQDNGHILPDRSFPNRKGEDASRPIP